MGKQICLLHRIKTLYANTSFFLGSRWANFGLNDFQFTIYSPMFTVKYQNKILAVYWSLIRTMILPFSTLIMPELLHHSFIRNSLIRICCLYSCFR